MKKLIVAFAVAIVINLVGMYVNYRSFLDTNYLKWSYRMYGGEFMAQFGFGLRATHHYAMRLGDSDSHSIAFSPVCLILFLLVTTAIAYAVTWIVFKIKAKRSI